MDKHVQHEVDIMTTLISVKKHCAVCGTINQYSVVGSCSTFGSLMSGSPLFMGISPLRYEFHRCHRCGYIARNLSQPLDLDESVLESEGYREAISIGGLPGGCGYILSLKGDHRGSAMAYLHGAWISDEKRTNDSESNLFVSLVHSAGASSEEEESRNSRNNTKSDGTSLILRHAAIAEFRKTLPIEPKDRMLMADMLRCVGEFDEASKLVDRILADPRCRGIWGLAVYERELIVSKVESARCVVCEGEDVPKSKVYHMTLDPIPFERIMNGTKHYELRLRDRKRRNIAPGDYIEFINRHSSQAMYVKVTEVRKFGTFTELYSCIDPAELGYIDAELPSASDMEKFYSKADQEKYGVLAIGVKVYPVSDGW